LDAPISKPPSPSEEERKRRHEIGRNYVIGRFNQHNELHHDLGCKLQLKKHAIKMLPRNTRLKEAALRIDEDYPPLWRNIPVETPPIENFDPSPFIAEAKEEEES
jgi:hypothetical protein